MSKVKYNSLDSWLDYLKGELSCVPTKRNKMALFFEGDAVFDSMIEEISRAKRFVHLEMYMFLSDDTGRRFAEALMERARSGIPVCVVYDGIGSLEANEAMFQQIQEEGVRVEVFRPVAPWRKRSGILGRNHRKNLIVDGRVAYTGGMNLGNQWSRRMSGDTAWRDTHLRVEGPAAAACGLFFSEAWEKVGGGDLDVEPVYEIDGEGPGECDCLVVGGWGFSNRKAIRRLYSGAFSCASKRVDLTVPYFVPPKRMIDAMEEAESRGVEVEVLVPGESDVRFADRLRECLYPSLIGEGLVFYEYERSILHAKTMVVDDRLAILGSANFDFLSISFNWELAVVVSDASIVNELREQNRRDIKESRKVDLQLIQNRSWWQKLAGWLGVALIRKL